MLKVREPGMHDIPAMIDMLKAGHYESEFYNRFELDEDFAVAYFINLIKKRAHRFGLVGEVAPGELIGMFTASIRSVPFSKAVMACDDGLYIKPEHRGTKESSLMIRESMSRYRVWADREGCVETTIGHTTGITPGKTQKIYEKLGAQQYGQLMRF